jgi:hypothetical protein
MNSFMETAAALCLRGFNKSRWQVYDGRTRDKRGKEREIYMRGQELKPAACRYSRGLPAEAAEERRPGDRRGD